MTSNICNRKLNVYINLRIVTNMKPLFESYAKKFAFITSQRRRGEAMTSFVALKNYWMCLLETWCTKDYLWTSFGKQSNKCYLSDIKEHGKYRVSRILT